MIRTMRTRPEFLAAMSGAKVVTPGFILQARPRGDDDPAVQVGFTCSKKLGNAVARNRAKRRLREIARGVMPDAAQPGWDYVLIGRSGETANRGFTQLCADLSSALRRVHPEASPEMDGPA